MHAREGVCFFLYMPQGWLEFKKKINHRARICHEGFMKQIIFIALYLFINILLNLFVSMTEKTNVATLIHTAKGGLVVQLLSNHASRNFIV